MRIHGGLVKKSGSASVRLFDDAFGRGTEDGQEARSGTDLRGIGTVALVG